MSLSVAAYGSSSPAKPSAQAQITTNWKAFFSGMTPASRKIALVQDGSSFAKVIEGQASSPMAKSVAATVSKVTLAASKKTATVVYSLTMGGKPALSNQKGEAVLQGGTWKVGAQSFCVLLKMEQVKVPVCSGKAA
jgi:hypothetical protein